MLDSPRGQADLYEYVVLEEGKKPEWKTVPVKVLGFRGIHAQHEQPHAHLDGASSGLPASVEDAYRTMAVVEAAYDSSDRGGTLVCYD